MTLILVEGLDRAGKTTRCRELMAEPRSKPRVMLHFVAPPKAVDTYGRKAASMLVLDEMMRVYGIAAALPEMDFVLDRGHVSWLAYEELLRGVQASPTVLRRVEAMAWPTDAKIEYVQTKGPTELLRRDDGLSTYTGATLDAMMQNIIKEAGVFERVLKMTGWPVTRRVTG